MCYKKELVNIDTRTIVLVCLGINGCPCNVRSTSVSVLESLRTVHSLQTMFLVYLYIPNLAVLHHLRQGVSAYLIRLLTLPYRAGPCVNWTSNEYTLYTIAFPKAFYP